MKKLRYKILEKGLIFILLLTMLTFSTDVVSLNIKAMTNPNENDIIEVSNEINIIRLTEADIPAVEKDIIFKGNSVVNLEEETDPNILSQYEAITEGLPVNTEILWNLRIIGADTHDIHSEVQEKVKVAIIDSGIDYLENIDVKERINLIPNTEVSPLFEDYTGHGTAIASILAGSYDNVYSSVKGVNPNVELYSARILDENNQAPLSRVLEGLYWAIDKDVDIISISFGAEEYSEALKTVIDTAVSKGILVIASAGNNSESEIVEYPAAFENVVAVGAVDSQGNLSDMTAIEKDLDVLAPGVAIRATGFCGEEVIVSGTSMAVPHVVGISSLIWQKDLSKDSKFVRTVLEKSSNSVSRSNTSVGLIDYQYANYVYDTIAEQYEENIPISVEPNQNEILSYDNTYDEKLLNTRWVQKTHEYIFVNKNMTDDLTAMKEGARYQDTPASGLLGMKDNPELHGYFRLVSKGEAVNYVACYRYMIKIANEYGKGNNYTAVVKTDIKGLSTTMYNKIRGHFSDSLHAKVLKFKTNSQKKAFLFGVAMHIATDVFAHSTYELTSVDSPWSRIKHNGDPARADDITVKPRRHTMALRVEQNTLYRFEGKRAEVPVGHDFHASGNTGEFYYSYLPVSQQYVVANFYDNAVAAGVTNTTVLSHYDMISFKNTNYTEADGD